MSAILVDSNVLLDIATSDAVWFTWSESQLRSVAAQGAVIINPVIYAELAPSFASADDLDRWLAADIFERRPLPYQAAWLAAQAFVKYRRAGGTRNAPLPDFFIGAHAETEGFTLLTRDAPRYRTYFPKVALICPG
ncbi:MAG TPA: type II toxin-antitoxin system VapC family toxin [Tepidisphaeraceae bacterium]|nr:type II toxin-antitoxin system VapC family toxin [Tepidisphaeraceae bacterium]